MHFLSLWNQSFSLQMFQASQQWRNFVKILGGGELDLIYQIKWK